MKNTIYFGLVYLWVGIHTILADSLYVNTIQGNDLWDGSSPSFQNGNIGPKATIQAAIDISNDGHTIWVADGTYTGSGNRDIDFGGRAVTLQSQNGPAFCIIDCQGVEGNRHRGFVFTHGEDESTIVDGFTITHGYADIGGAVLCTHSGPTIQNCVIIENEAVGTEAFNNGGGGVYCHGAGGLLLFNCYLLANRSERWGGGLYAADNFTIQMTNCLIAGNWAYNYGGAMYCEDSVEMLILNCTVVENSAGFFGGGVRFAEQCEVTITNTLFWNNIIRDESTAQGPKEISLGEEAVLALSYSDVENGYVWIDNNGWALSDFGYDNISLDPDFSDPGYWDDNGTADPADDVWVEGDYQLHSLSPCRNMGDTNAVDGINTDILGNNRVAGLAVDIGAYEMDLQDGPDLTGDFNQTGLEDPVVPGDKAKTSFSLINIGNETADGKIGLNFYLSEDNLLDESDITLAELNRISLRRFQSNAAKTIRSRLSIPATVPSGNYYLIAVIDPENTLIEADESIPSNVVLANDSLTLAWKFGEILGRKKVKLTVYDDNDVPVTFSLTGGWGEIIGDEQFTEIRLYNTTEKSSFKIQTKGKTTTRVGTIHAVDGSLRSISAKTTDLDGDIIVEGILKKLDLHDIVTESPQAHVIEIKGVAASTQDALTINLKSVTDLSVISPDLPIKSITCTEWLKTDGIENVIETPWLGKLTIKGDQRSIPVVTGDFEADMSLAGTDAPRGTSLGTVKIAGAVCDGVWNITGDVGAMMVGAIRNSSILIGVAADLNVFTGQADDFSGQYNLKSLIIKGLEETTFTDESQLAVWTIGKLSFPNDAAGNGYIQYAEIGNQNAPTGVTLVQISP